MRTISAFVIPFMCLLLLASNIANATTPCCHTMSIHEETAKATPPCHEMAEQEQTSDADCSQCDCMHCSTANITAAAANLKAQVAATQRIMDTATLHTLYISGIFQPPKQCA